MKRIFSLMPQRHIKNILVQFSKIIYLALLSTENYNALLSFKDQTVV